MIRNLLLLVHLVATIGTLGGLFFVQYGLSSVTRNSSEVARKAARLFSILITAGFLAGLVLYIQLMQASKAAGISLTAHVHGIVGVKLLILIAAGGLIGMSGKSAKGDLFRTITIVLLIIAAFFGLNL